MAKRNDFEEVKNVKDLPIRVEYGTYKNDAGELQERVTFYVEVAVDGESERVNLRIPSGMKKRQLLKRIESGDVATLRVKAGTFITKQGEKKYGCFFFVPLTVSGFECEVRVTVSGEAIGDNGKMDNRLERFLVLRELGLKIDSEGIEELDLPFDDSNK